MSKKNFIENHYYKSWKEKNETLTEDSYYNLVFNIFESLEIQNAFEVAIGDGEPFANKLATKVPVSGIDLSNNLIATANKNNNNISATYGDAETFKMGSYDLVYCLRSFWYFDDWKTVLKNMINSSEKYIVFDVLNGDNKNQIFNEINFRHTIRGKLFVATKNTIKWLINKVSFQSKYFMQPLSPLESYNLHHEIVSLVNKLEDQNISIECYGIETQTINKIDNDKDYRLIYKLTKQGN